MLWWIGPEVDAIFWHEIQCFARIVEVAISRPLPPSLSVIGLLLRCLAYFCSLSVLQLFLSSPRPTLRFAAVRTLNKVAIMQPTSVTTCNLDLENLITDVNRSIATLAITTLLKVTLSRYLMPFHCIFDHQSSRLYEFIFLLNTSYIEIF